MDYQTDFGGKDRKLQVEKDLEEANADTITRLEKDESRRRAKKGLVGEEMRRLLNSDLNCSLDSTRKM